MRRCRFKYVLLLVPLFSGCTTSDVFFNLFGDYYQTPDGASDYPWHARRMHFERQLERWEDYDPSAN